MSTGVFRHRFIPPPRPQNSSVIFAYTTDVVAPILTNAVMSSTGATSAAGSFFTDEANGIAYWVITTSITQPSVANIKAGLDHLGAAAADDSTIAVSTVGAQLVSSSILTEGVTYYLHAVHTDAALNDSNRITSNAFTPTAFNANLIIQAISNNIVQPIVQ